MPKVEKHARGTLCWIELATTDPVVAKEFYIELLGLVGFDMEMSSTSGIYTGLIRNELYMGGLWTLPEEHRNRGVPSNWCSYVSVDSVEVAAKRAEELGGIVTTPPKDIAELGRMAAITDPTGAMFAVWEPKTYEGVYIRNEPGALSWNELQTRDVDRAKKFYGDFFGWEYDTKKFGDTSYTTIKLGDNTVGGIYELPKGLEVLPPNWLVYFGTTDCDASTEKAVSMKAKVAIPPTDVPGTGRFSVLFDPTGALFALLQPAS